MEPAETVVVPQQIAARGEPPGTLPPEFTVAGISGNG
ncbi:hypothetical protein R69927_00803 [Paraburkholderia domus]|uniref:Uncharacterized protein n=1 Tax=Paraburkholderia domus TaxID=2793075 RepID=A0A9N8MKV1_9BURK|nr:hypothetical protein R70006_02502 [Paraburkholderia domus]CAE6773801.1 hypothetical protein R69749_01367 [Paraburkholderia domus]CAE6824380.1 hypothetical protein R69927_00803 [Paraburkholderia domus]CAE6857930.1 hypothetical protein R70199_00699 [Paraburkholderia domus]CAE6868868.1 hypothetical protein R70211_01043 [Paraburkholderia domus]